jgi:hypothetical protein
MADYDKFFIDESPPARPVTGARPAAIKASPKEEPAGADNYSDFFIKDGDKKPEDTSIKPSYIAGGIGAVAGPIVQTAIESQTGPTRAAAIQAAKAAEEAQKNARFTQLFDEYLLKHGIAPGTATTALDITNNAVPTKIEVPGLAKERAQQFGAKSVFEAGRQQKDLMEDLFRRGLVAEPFEATATRMGPTTASPTGRLLLTQAGAYDVDAAQQATNANELAARKDVLRRGAEVVGKQIAAETPGPLSRVASAAGRVLRSPVTGGVLGGLAAGLSVPEAMDRWQQGDRSGAVLTALGGASGIASMVPGLGIPAAAVGAGAAGATYVNDVIKQRLPMPSISMGFPGMSANSVLNPKNSTTP